jgi:nitroimidazol reductase NimA-like FMN-containing flavoprotein (pyridoxamine 5'-phosphate oxidase superfamily)
MSDMAIEAVGYIEKSSYALLVTVGEDNMPSVREIGPFVNKGLDIYFVTRIASQKVKHIGVNPSVTLYFPNMNQAVKEFRSIAVTGKAARVPEGDEFDGVLEKLEQKSPGYKKYIGKEGFKIWTIYKITAKSLQSTDYSKSTKTSKEEVYISE